MILDQGGFEIVSNSATEWAATSKHNDDDTTYTFNTDDGRVKEQ
jgi:hypothetical protein